MASETRIIKLGDQDWKVTPFHCVVGPITEGDAFVLRAAFVAGLRALNPELRASVCFWHDYALGVYVTEYDKLVAKWRSEQAGAWNLTFLGNPLIVNEYKLEEITLACIDEGKLIVTNFADLPDVEVASKIFVPGEFWLNYATGGAEKCLREGRPRKG